MRAERLVSPTRFAIRTLPGDQAVRETAPIPDPVRVASPFVPGRDRSGTERETDCLRL
jgi:hypothetical protein